MSSFALPTLVGGLSYKIPLLVQGPITIDELAEPFLIIGTEMTLAIEHVIPHHPLEGVRVLVGLLQSFLFLV